MGINGIIIIFNKFWSLFIWEQWMSVYMKSTANTNKFNCKCNTYNKILSWQCAFEKNKNSSSSSSSIVLHYISLHYSLGSVVHAEVHYDQSFLLESIVIKNRLKFSKVIAEGYFHEQFGSQCKDTKGKTPRKYTKESTRKRKERE